MNIPSYLNPPNINFMPELIQTLQDGLGNGIDVSNFTTAEIIQLEPLSPNGRVWFNSTLSKLQVKTAPGVIETITSV